eukprot:1063006-Ditylum_brightwellii.AAC.1
MKQIYKCKDEKMKNKKEFSSTKLQGKQIKCKLAEIFLRLMQWKDYCNYVSENNCKTNDGVMMHPPNNNDGNNNEN